MLRAGDLTQGLNILKSEGYDLMQKLQENALEDASEEYRQKIIDDFDKAM